MHLTLWSIKMPEHLPVKSIGPLPRRSGPNTEYLQVVSVLMDVVEPSWALETGPLGMLDLEVLIRRTRRSLPPAQLTDTPGRAVHSEIRNGYFMARLASSPWRLKISYCSEIWQASRQQCGQPSTHISQLRVFARSSDKVSCGLVNKRPFYFQRYRARDSNIP